MAVASLIFSFFSQKLTGKGVAFVCLVLGVVAFTAIGIPNLVRTRKAAGVQSAAGNLRTLNTNAMTYASTYGRGFPSFLAALGPPQEGKPQDAERAGLIDEVLASGRKTSYVFTYKVTGTDDKGFPSAYTINADPADADITEQNHYFTDESGVFRWERDHPASKHSPPLPG